MTGPEHYREAERLLVNVESVKSDEVPEEQQHEAVLAIQVAIAKAQVHATLALAAATVEASETEPGPLTPRLVKAGATAADHEYVRSDWAEAIS